MSTATLSEPAASIAATANGFESRVLKWTREQYYKLGELGMFEGKRVELIHGEIVEMSPIGWRHALATGLVSDALRLMFPTGFHVDVQSPLTVPGVVAGSEPQPDVLVVTGTRREYTDHPTKAALVVEVADTSLAFDINEKASLYASAGIADYWVLDLVHNRLYVFRDPRPDSEERFGHSYFRMSLNGPTDRVSPLAAPNASILVSELLP
jgi:Uma2 family endonuclease